jgi:hypothetical protein
VADRHRGERGGRLARGVDVRADQGEVAAHPRQGRPEVLAWVPHRVVIGRADGRRPLVAACGLVPAPGHELQEAGRAGWGVRAGVPAGLDLHLRDEPQQRDRRTAGLAFLFHERQERPCRLRECRLVDPDDVRCRWLEGEAGAEEEQHGRRRQQRGHPPRRHDAVLVGVAWLVPGRSGT